MPTRLALLVLLTACKGKDPELEPDAPEIAWLADGAPPVAPPDIPWEGAGAPAAPAFACPDGWRTVSGPDGETVCDPFPEGGHQDCESDVELHLPGEAGCRAVGSPCPSDGWPAGLPSSGVLYVRAGEAGTGTKESPYGTVGEALGAASAGETIAIAAGEYVEALTIDRSSRLIGACPAETRLSRSDGGEDEAVIVVDAEDVEIADLAVSDAPLAQGIHVRSGSAVISGVAVARVMGEGIFAASGAEIVVTDVVVSDVVESETWLEFGEGIGAADAEAMEVRGVEVRNVDWNGIRGGAGSVIEDAVVAGAAGAAFSLRGGTEARRVAALETGDLGLYVWAEGTTTIEDAWVSGDDPVEPWPYNGAIVALCTVDGTETGIVGRRIVVDGASYAGLNAGAYDDRECTTLLDLEDLVIRGVERDRGGYGGFGALLSRGADAQIARAIIGDTASDGFAVQQGAARVEQSAIVRTGFFGVSAATGATLELADVLVADAPAEPLDQATSAVVATGGASIDAQRLLVERSSGFGIVGDNSDDLGNTRVTLADTIVRDVGPDAEGDAGIGLAAFGAPGADAKLTADRLLIERTHTAGLNVLGDESEAILHDVRILDSRSRPLDGLYGGAIEVHAGRVVAERLDIDVAQGSGIALFDYEGASSTGELTDVRVSAITPMTCAGNGGCPGLDAATGLYLQGGSLAVDGLLVEGAAGAGLQARGGELTVTDAVVRDCAVGSNAQGGTVTLTRVDLTDNDAEASEEALAAPVP